MTTKQTFFMKHLAFLRIVTPLVLVDQLLKVWARSVLAHQPVLSYGFDTVRLVYAENTGAFLSLGANAPTSIRFLVMIGLNLVLLGGIVMYLLRKPGMQRMEWLSFVLILSGGVGNLLDRLFRQGVVIDYLNVGFGPVRTGIFNLADVLITAGILGVGFVWILLRDNVGLPVEKQSKKEGKYPVKSTLLLFALFPLTEQTLLADSVVYRTGRGSGRAILTGEILDFNQEEMTFRNRSPDTIRNLAADRILAISYDQKPDHVKAEQALKEKRYDDAMRLFENAAATESRNWVLSELQGKQIQLLVNQGEWRKAAELFSSMMRRDPDSRQQDVIPLHWREVELSNDARSWAMTALDSEEAYQRLIAASWLITESRQGNRAAKTLREMLTYPVPIYRYLAKAQLWRRELITDQLTDADLERWERQLLDLPERFRSGPMFVLGLGYERIIQKELAAARFLWLTTMDARNRPLAKTATLRAADLLESIGQTSQAGRLRTEAEERFN